MKASLISRIFFLFICLFIFASTTIAQEKKPRVTKVAQFRERSDKMPVEKLTEILENFISLLEKEPATTEGFINVPTNTELGKKIKLFVTNAGMESRVRYLNDSKNPKYDQTYEVSFLLVPQDAEIPKIYTLGPCICPTLDVIAPEIVTDQNPVLTFEAEAGDGDVNGLLYDWHLSAGKILEGQGTKTIKVDAQGAKEITAKVYIDGFCKDCGFMASFTTKIQ